MQDRRLVGLLTRQLQRLERLVREHGRLLARLADTAHESLRDDQVDRRGHEERLDAHVEQAADGARGVVRVQRAQHEVTRERRLDGDGRGLEVADLTDHDDVGVLAERAAQGVGEGQADLGLGLHLVGAGHLVLDRVLGRDQLVLDLAQRLPELTAEEVLQLTIVAKPGVLALAPAPKGLF